MATDIRWPPGVVMRRNGDCATMARTAAINSLSIGLMKPRSSTAPSAISSRDGCASATLSNRSAVNGYSFGIVKDHTQRMAMAGPDPTDAMAQINAISAACPLHRAVMHGKGDRIALCQRNHLGAGL